MLTVRYPNGQAITYNNAVRLQYADQSWKLYSDAACTGWVASIQLSAGVIVECIEPCKVENPVANLTLESAVDIVLDRASEIRDGRLYDLKKLLSGYNSRTGCWKQAA